MKRNHSSGNVLFLILIAVVLFAALSYAVTTSSRSGGSGADQEKKNLLTAQLAQDTSLIDRSIMRLRILHDCSDVEISLENEVNDGYDFGSRDECKIFHPDGGNLSWFKTPNGIGGSYFYNFRNFIYGQGCSGAVGCTDLIMFARGVSNNICLEVNEVFNNITDGTIPTNSGNLDQNDVYDGARSPNGQLSTGGTLSDKTGCFYESDYDGNIFYHVLIAR